MASSHNFDPRTKTFSLDTWGAYVQVYDQISSPNALAEVNFFDGVRDVEDLKKMRDVLIQVIDELQRRKAAK